MLSDIIDNLGTWNVAEACGVTQQSVYYWKKAGLPSRRSDASRRAHYERRIAWLAGVPVSELRRMIARR